MPRVHCLALVLFAPLLATCADPNARDAGADAIADIRPDLAPGQDDGHRADRPFIDPYVCPAAAGRPSLSEPLDATQTRAGRIEHAEELIGGEGAYGQIGHFKLYNQNVRFIVQGIVQPSGPQRPVGYDLYGGNIIDADRVRPAGQPGQDVLREMFPVVGFRVSSADEVTVVCDGSNGMPAALRVIGTDQPTRLIGSVDAIARRRFIRMITHYILRPGAQALEIRTRVDSSIDQDLPTLGAGEFLVFGGAALFTTETGFGDAMRARSVPFIAGAGDPGDIDRNVSYGIAPAQNGVALPIVDESGGFSQYSDISAPIGGSAEFVRYFAVGTGDVASVARTLLTLRNDPFGTATGLTMPRALVYAYTRPYAPGAPVRMMARATETGSFSMPLAAGEYDVIAVDRGRERGAPAPVTIVNGAEATVNPVAGPLGTLALDVAAIGAGGGRVRVPIKISLRGLMVEAGDPGLGNLEGERESSGLQRAIFSLTGIERVAVKPGRYHAIVSRGDEFDTVETDVTVPAAGEATLTADVRRVVDTTGMICGDFHQHTIGSVDSPRAMCGRVLENVAEGLEFAATTDHDNTTDFAPCIRSLGLEPWFGSTIGNEISVVGVGHFNAYPLAVDPLAPYRIVGAQYWADLTAQQLFDRIRAEPSDPVLHLSHPRSTALKGYFSSIGLDPITLESRRPFATGYQAIEVNDSLGSPEEFLPSADAEITRQASTDPTRIPVLRDFFSLVAHGSHVCALGNSDTHGRNDGSGWPRNHLRVGEDLPNRVAVDQVRAAIRAQRVVVSNGIVIRVRIAGQERMGWNEVVRAVGGTLDLEVDIQAAPWVPARHFIVYENGRPLALSADGTGGFDASATIPAGASLTTPLASAGTVRFHGTVRVHPTRDSFYTVVSRGDSLSPTARGSAFGYTNPVYVDVDGGEWQPPAM